VNVNFSKIVAFKGTMRKFLYVVAENIEGWRYPPYAYLPYIFRVNAPLMKMKKWH
jgi:hypothetical protein